MVQGIWNHPSGTAGTGPLQIDTSCSACQAPHAFGLVKPPSTIGKNRLEAHVQLAWIAEMAALGLAGWAAWLTIPRPPTRSWERVFKVALSSLLWGRAEAEGGTEAARLERWDQAITQRVPFHPAGRQPERKLLAPDPTAIAAPALEGERALEEALVRLSDPQARWRRMYVEDRAAADALTADPAQLGPTCDPLAILGVGASWEAFANRAPSWTTVIRRRLSHIRLRVWGEPAWVEAFTQCDIEGSMPGPLLSDASDTLPSALLGSLASPSERLVLIVQGASDLPFWKALRSAPVLRDRVVAMVLLGIDTQADPERSAWMAQHFRHENFDPELQRTTPCFWVRDVDPDAPQAHLPHNPLPAPPSPAKGDRETLEMIDLGPLPLSRQDPRDLAAACIFLLALRLSDG
jgi:hypothetical protein